MSIINVGSSKKKKKKSDLDLGIDKEKMTKESVSIGKNIGLAFFALAIAIGTYFFTKSVLVPDIAIWAREIISLILSLLVLAGFSAVSKGESKIGGSVVIFLFAIFIWQMVSGYSDYDFSQDQEKDSTITSSEVRVRTLYPRKEPYVFKLDSIGDSTEWIVFPKGNLFNYYFTSHDFGFKVVFSNGDKYQVHENLWIPDRKHPQLKLVATSSNQLIQFTVENRN